MKSLLRFTIAILLGLAGGTAFSASVPPTYYVNNAAFNGVSQTLGDGGSAQAASITATGGIAFDAAGNMYVSDIYSYVIRKVDVNGIVTTIAGNGTQGYGGDGGPALMAKLQQPNGVAVDAAGNVYFADGITRVRKVDTNGIITTVLGNGNQGPETNGIAANTTAVNYANSVAFDSHGNMYVAESGQIRMVNTMGIASTFVSLPSFSPVAICIDGQDNVYVSDNNAAVYKITQAGSVSIVAGTPMSNGFSGDGGPATSAKLFRPNGLAVDAGGNLFILDSYNYVVRMVGTNGIINTVSGINPLAGFGANGVPATSTTLYYVPVIMATGANGNIYYGDSGRVRMLSLTNVTSPTISTLALPGGVVGTAYSSPLVATGTAPITWNLYSGTLPPGLTLNPTGALTGTPTTAGTYNFTLNALNGGATNGTQSYTMVISTTALASFGASPNMPLNFAATTVGTATAPQTITIFNDGSAPFQITTILPPSTDFQMTLGSNCPAFNTNFVPGATCTLSFISIPQGISYRFSSIQVNATNGIGGQILSMNGFGNANLLTDALAFNPTTISSGGTSVLTLTISNTNAVAAISGNFAMNLPTGMVFATTPNAGSTCAGAIVTASAGTNYLSMGGATIPASGSCTVQATVTSSTVGMSTATLNGNVFSTNNLGTITSVASAVLTINASGANTAPIGVAMTALPPTITTTGTSTLSITLTNGNPSAATGVGFNMTYPNNMVNANPGGALSYTCTGGNLAAVAQTGGLTLSGATIPANGSCSMQVLVGPASSAGATLGPNTFTLGVGAVTSGNTPANTSAQNPSVVITAATAPIYSSVPPINTNLGANIVFGNQAVGVPSAQQQVVVSNTGNAPMAISSIMTSNPDYALSGNCPVSLAAGNSCNINIVFTPTHVGVDNGVLTVTDNATGSPHGYSLFGNGTAVPTVALSFTPTSIQVGATGTLVITLSNPSVTPATITSAGMGLPPGLIFPNQMPTSTCGGGGNLSPGAIQSSGGVIPASGSCTVTLQVQGTTAGTYHPGLGIGALTTSNGNNAVGATTTVIVGSVAGVSFSPTSLSFGTQAVGSTSVSQRSVLTNSGSAPLTISSFSALGDFGFVSNCPLSTPTAAGVNGLNLALAAGASCNIDVTFSPLSAGQQSSFVYVYDNAPGSPHPLLITGQGVLVQLPAILVSPRSLVFDDRVVGSISDAQMITVGNTGQANLNLSNVVVSGAFMRVAAGSSDCGNVVAPQASCQIAIVFAPNTVGAATGSVSITHNASTNPATVSLSGNGTPQPQPQLRIVDSLAFGDQIVGTASATKSVTLTNAGTASLTVSGVTLAGANTTDFIVTGNCVTSIAPNASCALTVSFKPAAVGAKAAEIDIASNAQNAATANKVALSGNGVPVPAPVARVSATTVGFGNVTYGGTPATQSVTLFNIGTGPLSLQDISIAGNTDFSQTNTCGADVSPLSQCSIAIRFTPHALGARSGVLVIRSNADGSPNQVQLGGTGCRYFSPTAARFFLTSC